MTADSPDVGAQLCDEFIAARDAYLDAPSTVRGLDRRTLRAAFYDTARRFAAWSAVHLLGEERANRALNDRGGARAGDTARTPPKSGDPADCSALGKLAPTSP